ncbi:MAG: protein translocase subunit SecF [Candidatus Eisenbacteria bacterium]
MLELIKELHFPFMHHRGKAYAFSLLVIAIGLVSLVMHKGFRLGVDFAGGRMIEYRFSQPVETEKIRTVMNQLQMGDAEIQKAGETGTSFLLRIPVAETEQKAGESPSARILEALQASQPGLTGEVRREELVGPKVGKELQGQATWAVTLALLAILVYVGVRYEFKFALGGVIALAHDVIVSLLMCSVFNIEITIPIIAALMTIGGYSINDTVVVFDRIREEMRLRQGQPLEQVMDLSIAKTMSRTILTSLTTFLSTFALFLLGGEVIHGFAFTMMVGVVFGTYSSVYIASALALEVSRRAGANRPAKVA